MIVYHVTLLSLLTMAWLFVGAVLPAQASEVEKLFPAFVPPNEATAALYPKEILFATAPVQIRYLLISTVGYFSLVMGCHDTALDFFGKRNPIPKKYCNRDDFLVSYAYVLLRSVELEFPAVAQAYGQVMASVGYDPNNRSRAGVVGVGNKIGIPVANYFLNDGWNSLGDLSGPNGRPFSDYTNYKPKNSDRTPPSRLRFPLRWQPLEGFLDNLGQFYHQIHVVPFLKYARSLVLSEREFRTRQAPSPYRNPNRLWNLSRSDKDTMIRLASEIVDLNANLTPEQRFYAAFWEIKATSLGFLQGYYRLALGLNDFEYAAFATSEVLAQYEAIRVVWKEKVRHDLVRPQTVIRSGLIGDLVNSFVKKQGKVLEIPSSVWESYLHTQPHSEYPSASSVLCSATLENAEVVTRWKLGPGTPSIPINLTLPAVAFPSALWSSLGLTSNEQLVHLFFESSSVMAENCGMSRLWAGVHFRPAVEEGLRLGQGLGAAAWNHVQDLIEGRVPPNCVRCDMA